MVERKDANLAWSRTGLTSSYPNSASVRPHKLCLSVRPHVPEPKLPKTGLTLERWDTASSWRQKKDQEEEEEEDEE